MFAFIISIFLFFSLFQVQYFRPLLLSLIHSRTFPCYAVLHFHSFIFWGNSLHLPVHPFAISHSAHENQRQSVSILPIPMFAQNDACMRDHVSWWLSPVRALISQRLTCKCVYQAICWVPSNPCLQLLFMCQILHTSDTLSAAVESWGSAHKHAYLIQDIYFISFCFGRSMSLNKLSERFCIDLSWSGKNSCRALYVSHVSSINVHGEVAVGISSLVWDIYRIMIGATALLHLGLLLFSSHESFSSLSLRSGIIILP